ncbi:MAG: tetratricopeptide repeat protein [Pyrinomonadaceae bacterium]
MSRNVICSALFAVILFSFTAFGAPCTVQSGQAMINAGTYEKAINEFTCVINNSPTEVEGYRGRIEAKVLLARYSDAVRDYQKVTAYVIPVHPDAAEMIYAGYETRLAVSPNDLKALTGRAFARWWFFDYHTAIQLLNDLVAMRPNDLFPNLFRGSSRMLSGATKAKGIADIEKAITIAPTNPHVRFIVADAFTYGVPDPQRAFDEASRALEWGLDTPRVHAILGTSYNKFGNKVAAAEEINKCIDLSIDDLVPASPLAAGTTLDLNFIPDMAYDIPITVGAGEIISIKTNATDYWDSIAVLLAPDGTPLIGSDDDNRYFAEFTYVAPVAGTYHMKVTFFEAVAVGVMHVTRD